MGYYFNNVDIITQSGRWLSEMSHHLLRRCWEAKLGAENLGQDLREFGKRGLLQFSRCYQLWKVLIISNTITDYSEIVLYFFLNLSLNRSVVLQCCISVGILSFLSIRGFFLIQDYLTVAYQETKNTNTWLVSTTNPGYYCDECYRNTCQEEEEKILFLY